MNKYLNGLILASSLIGQALAASSTLKLEGNYDCLGRDKAHPGVVFKGAMIIKKTGETFSVNSSFNDGGSYIGTAIFDKKKRTLSSVFLNPKNKEETGISIMDIKKNGSMTTSWTYLNMTTIGHASCKKFPEK